MLRVTKRSNFNRVNLNNFTIKKWGNNTPKNHFTTFQSQKLFPSIQPQNNNFNKTFCLIFRNFCTNSLKNDKEIENKAGKEKEKEKEKDCWYCHVTCDQTSQIFCGACKSILVPNPNSNHFELFNEDIKFDLNEQTLHKKFLRFQKQLHPDKFLSKSPKEMELSMKMSSQLNNAFTTLNNAKLRAKYLLELNNINIEKEQSKLDPFFLIKIMEINEEIDEYKNDFKKLNEIKNNLQIEFDEIKDELTQFYRTHSSFPLSPDVTTNVIQITSKLLYIDKLLSDISSLLPIQSE